MFTRRTFNARLCDALLLSSCCWPPSAWLQPMSRPPSIDWAERLLNHSSFDYQMSTGGIWDREGGTQPVLRDAEDAFTDILAKYGGKSNGRVWVGLARAQAKLGEYDKALRSFEQALSLLPGHRTLAQELSQVRTQSEVARTASTAIPKGETVLQALTYPAHGETNLWAVLSAHVKREKGEFWPQIIEGHLTIFQGKTDSLRIWRSGVLGFPGHTEGEFNDIYLYASVLHDPPLGRPYDVLVDLKRPCC